MHLTRSPQVIMVHPGTQFYLHPPTSAHLVLASPQAPPTHTKVQPHPNHTGIQATIIRLPPTLSNNRASSLLTHRVSIRTIHPHRTLLMVAIPEPNGTATVATHHKVLRRRTRAPRRLPLSRSIRTNHRKHPLQNLPAARPPLHNISIPRMHRIECIVCVTRLMCLMVFGYLCFNRSFHSPSFVRSPLPRFANIQVAVDIVL